MLRGDAGGEGNLRFSFKFEIFYPAVKLRWPTQNLLWPPNFSVILLWPITNMLWPLGGGGTWPKLRSTGIANKAEPSNNTTGSYPRAGYTCKTTSVTTVITESREQVYKKHAAQQLTSIRCDVLKYPDHEVIINDSSIIKNKSSCLHGTPLQVPITLRLTS